MKCLAVATALALGLAALAGASSAAAASNLGEAGNPYVTCSAPATYLQTDVGQAPSYTVPAGGGVITSWSTAAVSGGAQVELGVFRPTGMLDQYTTVGTSAPETMRKSSINSYGTRIPVAAGDTLGLLIVSGVHSCAAIDTGSPEDLTQRREGPLVGLGATWTYSDPSQPARRINVEAVMEVDADGNGVGDEPPSTRLTSKPPKRASAGKVKFRFASKDPGASFKCKLDGGGYKRCGSARVYTVKDGKHMFSVRAVDSDGHPDPTPAKYRFVVR